MRIDNFDTSTTGTEIELSISRDADASRIDYEEAFKTYEYSGYRTTHTVFYKGWDDSVDVPESVDDCLDLTNVSQKEARNWIVEQNKSDYFTARDIVQHCQQFHDHDWLEYLVEELSELSIVDCIRNEFPDIGIQKYETTSATGYSQGDYTNVLYDPSNFKNGTVPFDFFSNLIYNSPVYARVEIDGEEYYIDELLDDAYEWDKDSVAEKIRDAKWDGVSEESIDWICENLPEYPEYA